MEKKFKVVEPFRGNPNGALPLSVQQGGQTENDDRIRQKGESEMKKRKYGQGSIRKRTRIKNGRSYTFWEGRYVEEGKQKTVTRRTQKECEEELNKKIRERDNKSTITFSRDCTRKWTKATIREWLEYWFEKYKSAKKDSEGNYLPKRKATSAKDTENYIQKTIIPVLGSISVSKLSPLMAEDFIYSIEKSNKRKKIYDILHSAFAKLVTLGFLPRNVFDAIEKPTHKNEHKRPYTLEEQNAVLQEFREPYRSAYFFLCATGLRIGEFLALRRSDIDFERHFFRVDKSENKYGEITTPKTNSSIRTVFFSDELFQQFNPDLLGTLTRVGIEKYFTRALKRMGITGVKIQACRHTFATLCYSVQIPKKITQSMLGHSSTEITLNVYTDLIKRGNSPILEYVRSLKSTLLSTLFQFE